MKAKAFFTFVSILFLSQSVQAASVNNSQIWDMVEWFKIHAPTLQDIKDLKKFLSVKEHKDCLVYGKGCSRYTRAGLAMLDAIVLYGVRTFLIKEKRKKEQQKKKEKWLKKVKKKSKNPQLQSDLIHVGIVYPELDTAGKKRKLQKLKEDDPENYSKKLAAEAALKIGQ